MGSPLSLVMGNIFVEDLEKKAPFGSSLSSKRWKRYVDNAFVIWTLGINRWYEFLDYLNSINS